MLNLVNLSTTSGPIVLTFGTFAVRRFCKLTGCSNAPQAILAELTPDKMLDSLVAVILSGAEATAQKTGTTFAMSEYQACELADTLTPTESQDLAYAFIGSILGVSASEVPALLSSLQNAEPDPNDVTLSTSLPVGSVLSN